MTIGTEKTTVDDAETKTCTSCEETLPLEQFPLNGLQGRRNICKGCRNAKQRAQHYDRKARRLNPVKSEPTPDLAALREWQDAQAAEEQAKQAIRDAQRDWQAAVDRTREAWVHWQNIRKWGQKTSV